MVLLLMVVFILILVIELPALIKKHWYQEIAVFTVLFLIGVYLGMVQFYHWPFYNPFDTLLLIIEKNNW